MVQSYGITEQQTGGSAQDLQLEELTIRGYTVVPDVLSSAQLDAARERLDSVYKSQANEFGEDRLKSIKEKDMARCPLAYDEFFLTDIATNEKILSLVKRRIGDYVILHLQNGIINRPNQPHHQSSWHRDLPYQNFVISKPLAVGALFCLDPFTPETGCTEVLPFTHREDKMPSLQYVEANKVPAVAEPGSVIVFDAMLFHRAGYNSSKIIRRGVNNVYVAPILKQQIDLPRALKGKYSDDPVLARFLGYESEVAESPMEWRNGRLKRLSSS